MPVPLQIVFQGGGAKLCDLLAAGEAVQMLASPQERRSPQGTLLEVVPAVIDVTRLAGTSAGAIVAALLAAKIPIPSVREHLRREGPGYLKKITPKLGKLKAGYRLVAGQPLYNEDGFRTLLHNLFALRNPRPERFSAMTPVLITAADVLNGERRVFGRDPEDRVIDRVIDSCALPFVFRTATRGGSVVDGGLCENLPVEDLIGDIQTHGQVIAFSFKRDNPPVIAPGMFGYAQALINTMIANSVDRASRLLGDGNVYPIETNIGTFDFARALTSGLDDDHYGRVRLECKRWLEDLAEGLGAAAEDVAVISAGRDPIGSAELMERIYRVHTDRVDPNAVEISRSALIVTAFSLLPSTDRRSGSSDVVQQEVELVPLNGASIPSFSLGLSASGASPVEGPTAWNVFNGSRESVTTTVIPVVTSQDNVAWHRVIFFFSVPITSANQPYRVRQSNMRKSTLEDLLTNKNADWMRVQSTQSALIKNMDFVMHLPVEFSGAKLLDLPEEHRTHEGRLLPWMAGREMTDAELADYPMPPDGFIVRGWRAENVAKGQYTGVIVNRN
jgi:predicted acylesterase/phospholipase RssA